MDIISELQKYLKENPNLLNDEEKTTLKQELVRFVQNPKGPVEDVFVQFLEYIGLIPSDENEFIEYLMKNYSKNKFPRVLEVASGRTCSLAQKLRQKGYAVTAMDPDKRIKPTDERVKGIKMLKRKFTPDFAVSQYDIIVGYNACPVAGTLLSIKSKPTIFTICDAPETDGKLDIGVDISSKEEFIQELIKRNGNIMSIGNLTIIDNSRILESNKKFNYER